MFRERRLDLSMLLIAPVLSCGPPEVTPDCVPIDERLGITANQWCDGEPFPIELEWEGEIPIDTNAVCVAPEADGTCKVCPTSEVADAVEAELLESLAVWRPECQVRHWKIGCMRTIENGKRLEHEAGYCCFQVAVWGDDACK